MDVLQPENGHQILFHPQLDTMQIRITKNPRYIDTKSVNSNMAHEETCFLQLFQWTETSKGSQKKLQAYDNG